MLSRAFSRVTSSAAARRMMSSGGIDKWWEKSWADLFMAEIKRDGYRQFFIGQVIVLAGAFYIHNSIPEEAKESSVYYSKIKGTYSGGH
mmetsp:Transcript_5812/g.22671  ORF Transcript_5812/g.22671 Transcript_5812/m.22671 type:complete len:89 (+) Transcript_5812:61-327(+)